MYEHSQLSIRLSNEGLKTDPPCGARSAPDWSYLLLYGSREIVICHDMALQRFNSETVRRENW